MDRLSRDVVHEICTNQVVVTLQGCIKELVENALDAGATRIEVRLCESGSELVEVSDNGRGIAPDDFEKLASRHATSKIRQFDDLSNSLSTFGFRGEALAAICAMGDVFFCTKRAQDATAHALAYDRFGKLTEQNPAARAVGTTVTVRELFRRLPVRHREFLRNAKAQVSATLRLLQAYAIGNPQIRFHVVGEKSTGYGAGRGVLLSTSGSAQGWRGAAAAVLGDAVVANTQDLDLGGEETGWSVTGLVSTSLGGRKAKDSQLFYVNRRPIDPPKRIAKLLNDTFHQYNSRMWPVAILSFGATQGLVDVNVTPDKRTVFMRREEELLAELQKKLTEIYAPMGMATQAPCASLSSFGIAKFSSSSNRATADAASPDARQGEKAALTAIQTPLGVADHTAGPDQLTPEKLSMLEQVEEPLASCGSAVSGSGGLLGKDLRIPELGAAAQPAALIGGGMVGAVHAAREEKSTSVPEWKPTASEPPAVTVLAARKPAIDNHGFDIVQFSSEAVQSVSHPLAAADDLDARVQVISSETPAATCVPSTDASSTVGPRAAVLPDARSQKPAALLSASTRGPRTCTQVSVTMAELEAALERRRRLAVMKGAADAADLASAPRVSFPSAFSLSSLGKESELEEVAKFASGNKAMAADSASLRFEKTCFAQMRVIGQFNLGFIIAGLQSQRDDGSAAVQLFIVDQHASDEKARFEKLNKESRIDRQPLMTPLRLQMTPAQEEVTRNQMELFRMNGFEIGCDELRPPGRRFQLTSVPACRGLTFGEKDFLDLLLVLEEAEAASSEICVTDAATQREAAGGLLDLTGHRALWTATSVPRPPKVWQLLASKACRGAIMIGRALRVKDMERVLVSLSGLQQPWNCPHGRPTVRHLIDVASARRAAVAELPPMSAAGVV